MNMTQHLKHSGALGLAAAAIVVLAAEPALAQSANIEGVLNNIISMLTGRVATLLATIAVILTGIAWMFGYLDMRKAAYVVLGVAIIFGAGQIVGMLSPAGAERWRGNGLRKTRCSSPARGRR